MDWEHKYIIPIAVRQHNQQKRIQPYTNYFLLFTSIKNNQVMSIIQKWAEDSSGLLYADKPWPDHKVINNTQQTSLNLLWFHVIHHLPRIHVICSNVSVSQLLFPSTSCLDALPFLTLSWKLKAGSNIFSYNFWDSLSWLCINLTSISLYCISFDKFISYTLVKSILNSATSSFTISLHWLKSRNLQQAWTLVDL